MKDLPANSLYVPVYPAIFSEGAETWLKESIPALCTLIRQEGCQLWVLRIGLNSLNGPLNWTPSCRGGREVDPGRRRLTIWRAGLFPPHNKWLAFGRFTVNATVDSSSVFSTGSLGGEADPPTQEQEDREGMCGGGEGGGYLSNRKWFAKDLMKLCGSVHKFGQPTTRHMAHESSCAFFHLCGEVCSTDKQRFLHFYNFIRQKGWESWFYVTFFLFLFSNWIWSFQTTPFNDLQSRPRSGGGNEWLAPFGDGAKTLLTVLTYFQLACLAEEKRNLLLFEKRRWTLATCKM